MFLARDYSMNNPIIADAYNPTGFPMMTNSTAPDHGSWTVPVHLGPEVNTPSRDMGAEFSPDGLSLYFGSDRPAVSNAPLDIYVSRRACLECPWGNAQVLPSPIGGPSNDGAPALSHDGHLLFFSSDRGGAGNTDLWVSHRQNTNDDFGWEAPINLGPFVNSTVEETSPSFLANGDHSELYFNRNLRTWVATISPQGVVLGPAVQIDLGGDVQSASVRGDGRELVFWAPQSRGGLGENDIWISTRNHIGDPWSVPVLIGPPINTAGGELEAGISADGNTLVFAGTMTRGGSLGRQDLWIATRKQYFSFANTDIYLNHSQIGYGCRTAYW